jgi:exopolysaccharide biosynthesis protein
MRQSIIVASIYLATFPVINTQLLAQENDRTLDRSEAIAQASTSRTQKGDRVSLNGRTLPLVWQQWQQGKSRRTGIGDVGLMQILGVELADTSNYSQQPLNWFSTKAIAPAKVVGAYRYVDITNLAKTAGWQLQANGGTLEIIAPPARVQNLREEDRSSSANPTVAPANRRIVVELDRATPFTVIQDRTAATIAIEGSADPALIERFRPPIAPLGEPGENNIEPDAPSPVMPAPPVDTSGLKLESSQNQTKIQVPLPTGWRVRVLTVANPHRLVIDLAPAAFSARSIAWAPGIRWRQQFVSVGSSRFPVVWLEINPKQPGLLLRPIWSNPQTLVGIAPLVKTANLWQASAAVNAGFFNRKQQVPLGAIRRDGKWLSSPILDRGAIAWNDKGGIKIGRLTLEESLITSNRERLPILYLNSGYVKAGISRYTIEWGASYTPLTNNEILVVVQNNRVTNAFSGGAAGQTPIPIPPNGYVLAIRSQPETANSLAVGTTLRIESRTTPADFSRYSQILGAGPLLLQNRQIVLDAKAETFQDSFIRESAIRTAIGTTPSGTIVIAAVHNRAGGLGPTLTEIAQIMQQMGVVNALNLDGGSSTSLYLGGQLINRSASTAGRVHNGLGIFLGK